MRRLGRGSALLGVLLCGALLLVTTLPAWVTAPVRTALGAADEVRVAGTAAAPLVPGVALVLLAAGLTVGLAGRVMRTVASVLVALAGALGVTAVVALLTDPVTPARSAAGDLTGVRELAGDVTLSAWPYLALVVSVAALLLGAALPFVAGRWAQVGRRYERPAGDRSADAAPAPPRAEPREPSSRTALMEDWDALSRGEDPTAGDR